MRSRFPDTAANVAANLNTLNGNTHVRSIALTDPGTPALTLNAAQALSDTTAARRDHDALYDRDFRHRRQRFGELQRD